MVTAEGTPSPATSATLAVACVQLHWARTVDRNVEACVAHIRSAAADGCRVVLFPEANLTGYYFPYLTTLSRREVQGALDAACAAAAQAGVWAIVGTIRNTKDRYLNLAHVIDPSGEIAYEYAKVMMAGRDEQRWCRGGDKLALFEIDWIPCTLVICRDGRHPELYRIPAMAGAKVLFHPSCSSDEIDAVCWKRTSGRAQLPAGPTTSIFHCVANTVGQDPEGKQTSSGASFIRDPRGLPLAEAGWYQEERIAAVLDLSLADRKYALDSLQYPPFLRPFWQQAVEEARARAALPIDLGGDERTQ